MQNILKAATVAGVTDVIAKTKTVNQIIDEAGKRTEEAADFLEELERNIKEEEHEPCL